jgi:hypothetical protein
MGMAHFGVCGGVFAGADLYAEWRSVLERAGALIVDAHFCFAE